MTLKVTGKNLDLGAALRERATDRVEEILTKHFDRGYDGHVVFERTRHGFTVECVAHLDSGVHLHSHADAGDAHAAFEQAADRLEKRLRRYRRRLKDHHPSRVEDAPTLVLAAPGEDEEDFEAGEADNPVIVAEDTAPLPTLAVSEAVMRLDLSGQTFMVFRNGAHGGLNVIYRREDGNIGWLDPDRMSETAGAK